jgi:zinc protease
MTHRWNLKFTPQRRGVFRAPAWITIIAAWLGLITGASFACTVGSAQSEPTVVRATLPNGLRVVIIRNPIAAMVTTVVNYDVGSNDAPAEFPGMAHAQEHMMFRGSPGLTAEQLADINAAMGGMSNADTQQTVTQYFFMIPVEYLDVALHIEAIRMGGVLDSDRLWEQERGAIEQEVAQDLSNPEYVFYTRLLAAMFKGTPYAQDALGTKDSFDATTGAMLKQFYDTWYAPNNATIVIAGDVHPESVLAQAKTLFGPIPSKDLPSRPEVRLEPVQPETIRMKSDLPYSMVILAFRMPGYNSPDYAASQVLADVLDSQRGKLYDLAAEGKVLEASFQLNPLPKSGLGFAVASFPQSTQAQQIIDELRAVLTQQVAQGVPSDLVEAAKRREIARAEFQKNSLFGLAMVWSQALAVEGRHSPQDDIDAIARVTGDDVKDVARRYLNLDHAVTAILTPQASGKPVTAKGYGGTETFTLPQNRNVTLPSWAGDALARLTIPQSKLNTVQKILPNGITLIVQPASISRTVGIYGRVKNNPALQVPRGKEGLDDVLSRLFDYGTETLNRQAFQKALDDIAADVSVGTDFSLEVLKDHLDQGTRLLADNLLHPALPKRAFDIVRKQVAAVAAGDEKSPDELTHRALERALLPKNDPVLRWTTPKSAATLTLEDVRAYYAQVMRPDETIIVVIGDVTPEEAESVVVKYFGLWKAAGPKPDLLLSPVPANAGAIVHVPNKSRIQDRVILSETLGLTRSDPDYYALQLGNHVLGGGFYATRLYRDLREETGLVYGVDVDMNVDQRRAAYTVEYACDPANVEKARAIVTRNIQTMQTQPVDPVELSLAKTMLLREIPLSESSLASIAQGFIHRTVLDLPLDEPTRAAQRYVALTAKQVQAAFAKWLRPQDWVQVTEGPAPHQRAMGF